MIKKFTLLFAFTALLSLSYISSFAQMMLPASLEQRSLNAKKIAVGTVIEKHSYWDAQHHNIFTINLLKVRAYFKNDTGNKIDRIAVITSGGFVGNEGQITCPSFDFTTNHEYAVFLDADNSQVDDKAFRQSNPGIPQCELYASSQGVLGYVDGMYRDLMVEAPMSEVSFVQRMQSAFNLAPTTPGNAPFIARETPAPLGPLGTITTWTNGAGTSNSTGNYIGATIVANNELIITGSGFGATAGTVEFDHVDDGAGIGMSGWASTIASDVISWNDAQIRVRIPSKAGTGLFRVKDNVGTVAATSASNINIIWSQINVATTTQNFSVSTRQQVKFVNQNGEGGYTFQYSTVTASGNTFSTNLPAQAAFERALVNWRCNTLINFKKSTTTTNVGPVADGINSVSFNPALAANVLGSCITRFGAQYLDGVCDMYNTLIYVTELDVQMSPNGASAGWNYGPAATSGGLVDFESVMLHEIGHGHSCDHINTPALSMYYAVSTNTDKRVLTANEITCGDFRVSNSTSPFCVSGLGGGLQPMIRISAGSCATLPLHILSFEGNNINGYNHVQWKTTNEINTKNFEVERSTDGISFSSITTVAAMNTSGDHDYAFDDHNIKSGTYFYRLKMVDKDDRFTNSAIIKLTNNTSGTVKVFPNPAKDVITISGLKTKGTIIVYSAAGKIVVTQNASAQSMTVNLSQLSAGVYFLKYTNNDNTEIIKLVKE